MDVELCGHCRYDMYEHWFVMKNNDCTVNSQGLFKRCSVNGTQSGEKRNTAKKYSSENKSLSCYIEKWNFNVHNTYKLNLSLRIDYTLLYSVYIHRDRRE